MISQTDAKTYYDAGKHYSQTGMSVNDSLYDYFGWYCDWSAYACFELGYNGKPFEVRQWERYREISLDAGGNVQPSYNRMDDRLERGVSVIYPGWAATVHGMFYIANAEAKGYKKITISGIDTGRTGGDGEPLVIPIDTAN